MLLSSRSAAKTVVLWSLSLLLVTVLSACGGGSSTPVIGAAQGESATPGEASPGILSPGSPQKGPTVSGTPETAVAVGSTYRFTPTVSSEPLAENQMSFFIENLPVWASFDSDTGTLSGTPDYTHVGVHVDIRISVGDASVVTQLSEFTIEVTMDEVELALVTGDVTVVSAGSKLEDALLDEFNSGANLMAAEIVQIFNLDVDGTAKADGSSLTSLDWNPTHDAAVLSAEFGENTDLLITNAVTKTGYDVVAESMAIIGQSTARYIVMGSNPMANYRRDASSLNEHMHRFLENSLAWLSARDDLKTAPFSVVLAHLDQSYYFPHELGVREWLDERFPGQVTYNDQDVCDGDALAGCLMTGVNALIISSHQLTEDAGKEQIIADAVAAAMRQGVPVLYLHLDGGKNTLSDALFKLFDVRYAGDNYWRRLGFEKFDITAVTGVLPKDISALQTMVENFKQDNFVVDWTTCDDENCNANTSLNSEFLDGAAYARSLLAALDESKSAIFTIQDKYRFIKLLALLGDHYRSSATFPMDKLTTPASEFFRAYYADHATYQYRDKLSEWPDLGNFSRTDFSHITPTTRKVSHTSKVKFKSTGAYALPGKVVTVTRNDTSAVGVKVRVNTLRNGSTHIYADNGYTRPRLLQSQSMPIEPGETIRFVSAIGGPLQLEYDTNGLPVEVVFGNIGEHAYWASSADDESFAAKLIANEYDWAEIAAPSFEVHSKLDKMIESMADPVFGENGGTPKALSDATMRYVHNFPHVLAGFKGPGVDVVDEIHQFAADQGLEVATLDLVKHMNADQATCGYGCSGNPYDAYWSFSPIGHGDIHELGHGLERRRFRFQSWEGHSITNPYSYYTKSQYFKDSGEDPDCQSLPFQANFEILQASFAATDPNAFVKTMLWTNPGWNTSVAMTIQMMMAAQDNGALVDGWHLLARMHILEREYQKAIVNDADWSAKRVGLGMGSYARNEARDLSEEDWLLIVISHATGFDMRAYFDVWGHSYTATAADQVISMNLPSMPLYYYVSSGDGYCQGEGFDGSKLPIDGVSVWPATP